ncbi:MAG: hypothetical protein HY207_13130 [Nitrospirae bacterium]|nr:hypothetical protein [Nitrospirota bacterium]
MTPRHACTLIAIVLTAIVAPDAAWAASPAPPAARNPPVAKPSPPSAADRPAAKPKPRRVLIFGTTIVGDVLKPPIDRTVPWQSPPAFRTNAAPLAHDFTRELLTPLDREQILRDAGDHTH